MKVRSIKIGIGSVREGLKEFVKTVKAIQAGRPPQEKQEGVYFTDLEAMRRVLTPKRLELLRVIRERRPESVYQVARMTKRDLKNVQDDVGFLSRLGLISLSRPKVGRERVVPRVPYDSLEFSVPLAQAGS